MSFSELGLILIIGLLVLKPDDLKSIGKFTKNTLSYLGSLKEELWSMLDSDDSRSSENTEQINKYLEKIIRLSGKYDGRYDLGSVKAYYHKLILSQKINDTPKSKNPSPDNV